jgi:hypothetical protein
MMVIIQTEENVRAKFDERGRTTEYSVERGAKISQKHNSIEKLKTKTQAVQTTKEPGKNNMIAYCRSWIN